MAFVKEEVIYVANSDGSKIQKVADAPQDNTRQVSQLSWSPDGSKLHFIKRNSRQDASTSPGIALDLTYCTLNLANRNITEVTLPEQILKAYRQKT